MLKRKHLHVEFARKKQQNGTSINLYHEKAIVYKSNFGCPSLITGAYSLISQSCPQ